MPRPKKQENMDPEALPVMTAEWDSWQKLHKEFTKITGIDIEDPKADRFVALVKIWGERLAMLRAGQGVSINSKALREEIAKLEKLGAPHEGRHESDCTCTLCMMLID